MFIWTKKAEKAAKQLGLEERKEGTIAKYGNKVLNDGPTARAWIKKGYVIKSESNENK